MKHFICLISFCGLFIQIGRESHFRCYLWLISIFIYLNQLIIIFFFQLHILALNLKQRHWKRILFFLKPQMWFEVPGSHRLIHQVFDFLLIESFLIRLNLNDHTLSIDEFTGFIFEISEICVVPFEQNTFWRMTCFKVKIADLLRMFMDRFLAFYIMKRLRGRWLLVDELFRAHFEYLHRIKQGTCTSETSQVQ